MEQEVNMSTERVNKKRGREEECDHPLLSREYLLRNYQVVNNIVTPQCILILFWFPGRPAHCTSWKVSLEEKMDHLSFHTRYPHWDLFPAWFAMDKDEETQVGRLPLLKPLKRREPQDIFIQVSSKLTWVFRPTPPDQMKHAGYLINHCLLGNHEEPFSYERTEAQALYLILKEYHKNESACNILDESYWYTYSNKQKEKKDKLPYLYLYEALFTFYGLKIAT